MQTIVYLHNQQDNNWNHPIKFARPLARASSELPVVSGFLILKTREEGRSGGDLVGKVYLENRLERGSSAGRNVAQKARMHTYTLSFVCF